MKKLIFHNPFLIFYLISCCFVVSYALVSFRCLSDQSSALLQLKEEFGSNKPNSSDASHSNNMVMDAWNVSTDCCFWSGVRCNMSTGHVLGLDLSNSGLRGPLSTNSSLFSLDQLQQLSLASNYFKLSQIPSTFGQLSRLTHLNLSNSVFSGDIPQEISLLIDLVSLDLSGNYLFSWKLDIRSLVQNMSNLRELHLDGVKFYSSVPESLASLSSLTSLSLSGCSLGGKFPRDIFQLPNILAINVSHNDDLIVLVPEFGLSSSLSLLDFSSANFSGKLPESIGYLKSLKVLVAKNCQLSGTIPPWVGNLSQLRYLDLSRNELVGHFPSILGNLSQLTYLDLSFNRFHRKIPPSLGYYLPNLTVLGLAANEFWGKIPSSIGNLSQLTYLDLSDNHFHGNFPASIANLTQLLFLSLSENGFAGPIPSQIFGSLNSLNKLDLSQNSFIGVVPPPFFKMPSLKYLRLDDNQLRGPLIMRNISSSPLTFLSLDRNKLNAQIPKSISKFSNLRTLSLRSNNLTGRCEFGIFPKLNVLDLSNNSLSGTLPQCFGISLVQLNLQSNDFHGSIPEMCAEECNLRVLSLGQNQLQGTLPKSLTKCKELRILDVSRNQIVDTFPFSLQTLPKLAFLVLRGNKFHGPIWHPDKFWGFVDLHVFDVSFNNFSGSLPSEYFGNWSALIAYHAHLDYLQDENGSNYRYSMAILFKGIEITFTLIDLSNNQFRGKIPDTIGDLEYLIILNLSGNSFDNLIPSSLGRLTTLESLDLSRNKLSGRIPEQLANLTMLSYLDLSLNQLTGQIPPGVQLASFDSTSYEGNFGLCGPPLSKGCDKNGTHTSLSESREEGFESKSILRGYGCGPAFGFIIGLIAGYIIVSNKLDSFVETWAEYIRSHIHRINVRGHTTCGLFSNSKPSRAH